MEITEIEQTNILDMLSSTTKEQYTFSQNGLKYRTICKECNNNIGANYDTVLNTFTKEVSLCLKTNLILPEIIHIKTNPVKIMKAVLGHLLAAKLSFPTTVPDMAFRQYMLDARMTVPNGYKVCYWIYPYNNVTVARDFLLAKVLGPKAGEQGMFSVLKYFPIAYLVTDQNQYDEVDELTKYCTDDPESEVTIPVNLRSVQPQHWPEVSDDGILLAGDDLGIFAKPRARILKKQ